MHILRLGLRATLRLAGYGLLAAAAICLLIDLRNFHELAADYCQGVQPNTADYCSNSYNVVCQPVPADCGDKFPGYIAPHKANFLDIVPPDWGKASILGYGWWVIQLAIAAAVNGGLFAWYVIRQPFVINPLLWVVLLWLFSVRLTPDVAVNPLLKKVQDQKALGDASVAKASDVHLALLGQGTTPTQEFEV